MSVNNGANLSLYSSLLKIAKISSRDDLHKLKNATPLTDAYIRGAIQYLFAPCSEVIRLYSLMNIYGMKDYSARVYKMMKILSNFGNTWLEGYSFWRVTRDFILYAFVDTTGILALVDQIDAQITHGGYDRAGIRYPAPFGKLIDEYIEFPHKLPQAREFDKSQHYTTAFVRKPSQNGYTIYTCRPCAVALNTDVPALGSEVSVINGQPYSFRWWRGNTTSISRHKITGLGGLFLKIRFKSLLNWWKYLYINRKVKDDHDN